MMQTRDWVSGGVGLLIFLFGLFPLLHALGRGPSWWTFTNIPLAVFAWGAAIGGFYLIINSLIEITNSNIVGWMSFIVAAVITVAGVLHILGNFGMVSGFLALGWIPSIAFNVIFVVLGLFLMIATFAMEL